MHVKRFNILKFHQPPDPDELRPLSMPDELELAVSEPGRVVEVGRLMTEEEAAEVATRPHIAKVEPDYEAHVVSEVSASGVTSSQAAKFHRISDLPSVSGTLTAVLDTGISEELYNRYKVRVKGLYDVLPDEDWRDHTSKHGSYCCSVYLGLTKADLLAYKVLSTVSGSGSYSGVIKAIEHARNAGAKVMSLSLGGPASDILDNAVNAAADSGILVVVAAGNEQRGSSRLEADLTSPARARGAVCVGAVDVNGRLASFSNKGNTLEIAGLGVDVQCPDADLIPGGWSGTSMSAPYAGATAVAAGVGRNHLLTGARDTGLLAVEEGHGIADALGSYQKANPVPEPVSPAPDCGPKPTLSDAMKGYWASVRKWRECRKANGQEGSLEALLTRFGKQ